MLPLRDNVPTRTLPVVTIGLIVANALVWFWELKTPGVTVHVFRDGYYPCTVSGPCHLPAPFHALPWYEGVFTGMFMHASWQHIGFNMLFLWIFGNNIEDALGHVRFLVWYLAAGIAAMAAQTAVTLWFGNASDASIPNIGASGAIAGVLGAYFVLLPRARVLTLIIIGFIFIREIPAIWFLGIWIALQVWTGGLSTREPAERRRDRVLRPHRRLRLRGRDDPARDQATAGRAVVALSRLLTFDEHVERALASLPAELREAIRNVEISVEDEDPDDPDVFGLYEGVPLPERGDWAGAIPDRIRIFRLPARRVLSGPGRARGRDPDHGAARGRPLLRDRRGPARRPRVFLRIWAGMRRRPRRRFKRHDHTTLASIHAEIERLSEERAELWHRLSAQYDPEIKEEIRRLDTELGRLWDEHRALRARMRFGDRDKIVARARVEERLERAA